MSYKEDVQAVDITLHILSKSSVIYMLKPFRGSKEAIKDYIEQSDDFINYGREDIALSGTFVMEADSEPSLIEETILEDTLAKTIFFMKSADVELYDDGVKITVDRLSISEYDIFFTIIEDAVSIQDIYVSDIIVFYQNSEEIEVKDVVPLESYTGNGVYKDSIHVRV